jgi:anti-sigma-K factor RskA
LVNLESAQHRRLAQFVVLPDGRGYLVRSALPTLSSKDTYQLWAVVSGQPISLGLMGRDPNQVSFTLAGARRPATLGLTVEPASGSVVPSSTMLASGTV